MQQYGGLRDGLGSGGCLKTRDGWDFDRGDSNEDVLGTRDNGGESGIGIRCSCGSKR